MPEKHGYEDWTVEQLRKELVEKYGINTEEVNSIKGKLNLVTLILEKQKLSNTTIDDGLPGTNSEDLLQDVNVGPATPNVIPDYGSEEWQDFILNELTAKEKEGNFPKCSGLRRLVHKYLGNIVESGPIQVFAPTSQDGPGRATVVWRVIIEWKMNIPDYINLDSFREDRREFSDVADCWIGNTPATYAVHPSSTAATRAEGRALKKALMLNLLTAEEMSNDKSAEIIIEKQVEKLMGEKVEWSAEDKATATQKNFIAKKCDSMNIDINKFINKSHYVHGDEVRYSTIEEVSRGVAAAMIEELNRYQNESSNPGESKSIPEQIKKNV